MQESLYVKRARISYWDRVAFLTYATLGTSKFDSRYRWNPDLGVTGRYIDKDGRIVKQTTIVAQLENVIIGAKSEVIALALDLQDGKISVQTWYNSFSEAISIIHGVSASLVKGGWAQMTPADWELTKEITSEQLGYLNKFAQGVDGGQVPLDGNFIQRVNQYIGASRSTAEEIKRQVMLDKATHEKRVLGPADHCHTDKHGVTGCWELFKLGWQPIGTLPKIGETPCRHNCHCHFVYGIYDPALGKIVLIE